MQELAFVEVEANSSSLIVENRDGTRFAVSISPELATAVTKSVEEKAGEATDLGALNGAPTPREIQDRIRHGHSVEDIATQAHVPVEKIERFAYQVLTERNFVAVQASTRVVTIDGNDIPLDQAVADQLRGTGVDLSTLDWDAWLRADGQWTVAATVKAGTSSRRILFAYDQVGHKVSAADDESRSILNGQPVPLRSTEPSIESTNEVNTSIDLKAVNSREVEAVVEPVAVIDLGQDPDPELVNRPIAEDSLADEAEDSLADEWEGLLFGASDAGDRQN